MTRELMALDLYGLPMREIIHLNGGPVFSGAIRQCIKYPRLQRKDKTWRKTKKTEITYLVDGEPVASLDEAAQRLSVPPVLTPEWKGALANIGPDFADHRRSITYSTLRALCDRGLIELERGLARRMPEAPL